MREASANFRTAVGGETPQPMRSVTRVPIVALGMGLGTFLGITFVLCVLFDLWFPGQAVNSAWAPLLPGFTWLSWPSFFLGLVEAFLYPFLGIFISPIFAAFAMTASSLSVVLNALRLRTVKV